MTEVENSGHLGEISCIFYAVNIILKNRGAETYKFVVPDAEVIGFTKFTSQRD
jgi:hypothetical protein